MHILNNIILFTSILILINQNKTMAKIKFNAYYYSSKSIYKSEYKIDFYQRFNDKITIGGYIKQNTINKNRFEKYLNNNNYNYNLNRKFSIVDKENYFYNIYLKLKITDFKYQNFDNLNNSVFFNILYFNNIKYFIPLKLTFISDVYERYGIGVNYLFNDDNFINNFYINYIKNRNNLKNTLNLGFNSKNILSDSFILIFNYDYYKDFNKKDNNQHILNYKKIYITYYYSNIMNESHNFNLGNTIIFDDYLDFTFGFSYIINKNYNNSFGINFNIRF